MNGTRDVYEDYLYALLEHAPTTQEWTKVHLGRFISWLTERGVCDIVDVGVKEVREYTEYLKTRPNEHNGNPLSAMTVHGHLRAIRAWLNWCVREGYIERPRKISMPRVEQKIVPVLDTETIDAMFKATENEFSPELIARDKAILSVLLDTGIRVSELCGLLLEHVHIEPQEAYIRVLGKGNKWREVGLGTQSRIALHRYVRRFRKAMTPTERHVFLTRHKIGFTRSGLNQVLYRLAEWAGIDGRVSAHVWRHTYATMTLANGGEIYKLSRSMGHSGVHVTEGYLRSLNQRESRNESVLDKLKGMER